MKKQKEIVHQIQMGQGMITTCGSNIRTSFDRKGVPSYDPKYTTDFAKINCPSCIHIIEENYKKHNMAKLIKDLSKEGKSNLEKPVKPIEPKASDLKYVGDARSTKNWDSPFVVDYKKYQKDLKKYEERLEVYEQLKLIRFIKNADEKLILRKYKITKK